MKKLLALAFILYSFALEAQLTYRLYWQGNMGGSAIATLVIDETVCLEAGTCDGNASIAADFGIIDFNLLVEGNCGGEYSLESFSEFIIEDDNTSNNLQVDLITQIQDFNVFSNDGPSGSDKNLFIVIGCGTNESFELQSILPSLAATCMDEINFSYEVVACEGDDTNDPSDDYLVVDATVTGAPLSSVNLNGLPNNSLLYVNGSLSSGPSPSLTVYAFDNNILQIPSEDCADIPFNFDMYPANGPGCTELTGVFFFVPAERPIPSLGQWGLIILSLLISIVGIKAIHREKKKGTSII